MINPILDSGNLPINVSNIFGNCASTSLSGLPLGAIGNSALGEIFLKVGIVSGSLFSAKANAAAPTYVEGTFNGLSQDLSGRLRVVWTNAIPAGSAIIGKIGIDQTTPGTTNLVSLSAETTKKIGQIFNGQYAGVPSSFAVQTVDQTVFTLAAGEVGFIQNLDDAALAIKKGSSASTSSFSFILAAGTATDDGKGGYTTIKDWVGVVSVAAMAGTARYIAWKQAA